MKLLNLSITNFGSWQTLQLDLSAVGLTAISGVTGSGKSGLADSVSWCLFGETSKEGASDDVRSWGAEEPTTGSLSVEVPDGTLEIHRIRGSALQNDLYWIENDTSIEIRGKNLPDTQKLLNERLGVTPELYFTASYFHQFSKADTFFIAKAQERRALFEKIVDQDLAITVGANAAESRKEAKKCRDMETNQLAKLEGKYQGLQEQLENLEINLTEFTEHRDAKIVDLEKKIDSFETVKAASIAGLEQQIQAKKALIIPPEEFERQERLLAYEENRIQKFMRVSAEAKLAEADKVRKQLEISQFEVLIDAGTCPTCYGQVDPHRCGPALENAKAQLKASLKTCNALQSKIIDLGVAPADEAIIDRSYARLEQSRKLNRLTLVEIEKAELYLKHNQAAENKHVEQLHQLKDSPNPYELQIIALCATLEGLELQMQQQELKIQEIEHTITLLTLTYDASYQLRGVLLSRVITEIENTTNQYLQTYFDADLKVQFNLADADKLEVLLSNNGNSCTFRQLSGGERCLLKLAFNLSVMLAAANKAGVKFNCLFLDEILNGLSDDLKLKAFGLLQDLAGDYDSVLVVDHCPALINLFDNTLEVSKTGERSEILTYGTAKDHSDS